MPPQRSARATRTHFAPQTRLRAMPDRRAHSGQPGSKHRTLGPVPRTFLGKPLSEASSEPLSESQAFEGSRSTKLPTKVIREQLAWGGHAARVSLGKNSWAAAQVAWLNSEREHPFTSAATAAISRT